MKTIIISVLNIVNRFLIRKKNKILLHCFKMDKYPIVHCCQWGKILTSQNGTQTQ